MRATWIGLLVVSALASTGRPGRAACDPTGVDATDVAAARTAVSGSCPCDSAFSASLHKRCAKATARTALSNPGCVKVVVRCAANSICGRPGAVSCCRTSARGRTRCKIARDASACRPPRDGTACIGAAQSCCDACAGSDCALPVQDVAGDWTLSGDVVSSSCSISPPTFESHLSIEQAGATLHATGATASYDGTVSASDLTLLQAGLPRPFPCPGGFYDGFLNLSGGAREADGSIAITQRWGLFPPVSIPGCEPCSVEWSGRMTPSAP
jgi:hypothetical protein